MLQVSSKDLVMDSRIVSFSLFKLGIQFSSPFGVHEGKHEMAYVRMSFFESEPAAFLLLSMSG